MFAQKTEYFIDFYVQNPRTYMNNNQIKVEDCTLREKFSFNDYDNKQTIRSLKEYLYGEQIYMFVTDRHASPNWNNITEHERQQTIECYHSYPDKEITIPMMWLHTIQLQTLLMQILL